MAKDSEMKKKRDFIMSFGGVLTDYSSAKATQQSPATIPRNSV